MKQHKLLILISAFVLGPLFAFPSSAGAVDVFDRNVCERNINGSQDSAICKDKELKGENPLFGPEGILTSIINILSIVIGIVAIIAIILAGLKFITSGTNPQEVSGARERIIYASIGLIIAVSAQAIVQFILKEVAK